MKKESSLKLGLIVSIIILLSLISFVGVFGKKDGFTKNMLPKYIYGMDFGDRAIIGLSVIELDKESQEETTDENIEINEQILEEAQNQEQITEELETEKDNTETNNENSVSVSEEEGQPSLEMVKKYILAKNTITERLKELEISEFYTRLNRQNGQIIVEIPLETESTKVQSLYGTGKFTITNPDGDIISDNSGVEDVKVAYSQITDYYGTPVDVISLNIEFNKEITKKIEEISNLYVPETDEEGTAIEKNISLNIDGDIVYSEDIKSINNSIDNGVLKLTMGRGTETKEELKEYYGQALAIASLIKHGPLPLEYEMTFTNIVESEMNINSIIIIGCIIGMAGAIYLIKKYKLQGFFGIISLIGLVAVLLIIFRYTNIVIAFEGVFAALLVIIINYMFLLSILEHKQTNIEKVFNNTIAEFGNIFIISLIISIIFCFSSWLPIFSFGMIMFWGVIITLAYNFLITKNLIANIKNK